MPVIRVCGNSSRSSSDGGVPVVEPGENFYDVISVVLNCMSSHHRRPLLFSPSHSRVRDLSRRGRASDLSARALPRDRRSYRTCIFQRRTAAVHKVAPELMAESFASFASFGDFFR